MLSVLLNKTFPSFLALLAATMFLVCVPYSDFLPSYLLTDGAGLTQIVLPHIHHTKRILPLFFSFLGSEIQETILRWNDSEATAVTPIEVSIPIGKTRDLSAKLVITTRVSVTRPRARRITGRPITKMNFGNQVTLLRLLYVGNPKSYEPE